MPETAIIVPCRIASTRFPRKLLHPVRGRPVVLWTAHRIRAEVPEMPLFFAVDDPELGDCLAAGGFSVVSTRRDHPTGTDRLAEANAAVGARAVLNVQADEPLVTRRQIELLAATLAGGVDIATLACRFSAAADFHNPNQVKVVCGRDGRALYFSRAPVPWPRDRGGEVDDAWLAAHPCYRHLGLYGYRADFLDAFAGLPKGRLEALENLEQLRALENGYTIGVGITDQPTVGIDVPDDIAVFEKALSAPRAEGGGAAGEG